MTRQAQLAARDADAVREFAERVRAVLGPELVALKLFGSKATGNEAPDSDIDILVVVEQAPGEVRDRIIDVAFDVNLAHGVYISPRVVARVVLDDPVWKLTSFLQAVERDGIPL